MTPPAPHVRLHAWQSLTPAERDAVAALRISPAQVEFAGTTARGIAACERDDLSQVAGLAIRADGAIVGWVLLKRGSALPGWAAADAAVVGGLRIDQRHQGHGLGTLAVVELASWVGLHWPSTARLMLRVDEDNAAGIRAYEKAGWREVGNRRTGRVGTERTMALALDAASPDGRESAGPSKEPA